MDAKTIYKMMKPQLDLLEPSEKMNLSKLIGTMPAKRISCQHRKTFSLSKAKEKLRNMCNREILLEKLERQSS